MKWTVTYSPDAQDDLAEIWMYAGNRPAVAQAADQIDRLLAQDPLQVGESREGITRIVMRHPLAAQFDVYQDDFRVVVLAITCGRR